MRTSYHCRTSRNELPRARHLLAHQLAQAALTRHEAADRDRPVGRFRLRELRDLGTLLVQKPEIGGVGREPEDRAAMRVTGPRAAMRRGDVIALR